MSEASPRPGGSSRTATFYPLLNCNARCPFCSTRVYTEHGVISSEDYRRDPGRLRLVSEYTFSLEQAKESFRELRAQGVDSVHIQGGEPTVYEPLAELIAYGEEIGFRQQVLVTNGRMFRDRAYAERIVPSGISTIAFSIFGATAAMHDESLGVEGAFDDMVLGVENVVAVARRATGRRVQVSGQIILHAKNFRALPAMVAFWNDRGLRSLGVRLLRETANLEEKGDGWFFDLRELRPYLQEALDISLVRPDLALVFGEIFYCVLEPSYLGFVLAELQASRRLWTDKVLANKHRSEVNSFVSSRDVIRDARKDPCDACDLKETCVKVERVYQPHFTGSRVSVDVRGAFESVLATGVTAESYLRLRKLLSCEEALDSFGVPEASRTALHRKLVDFAKDADRELPSPLSVVTNSPRRVEAIQEEWKIRALTFLKLSDFGPTTLLRGDGKALLARLATGADAAKQGKLAALEKAECLMVEPLLAVYAGRADLGPKRPSVPFLAIVYNDEVTTPEMIERFLGPPAA